MGVRLKVTAKSDNAEAAEYPESVLLAAAEALKEMATNGLHRGTDTEVFRDMNGNAIGTISVHLTKG